MLDTDAIRLDIADVVRTARRSSVGSAVWWGMPVEVDERCERLVVDDLRVDLERVGTRLPSGQSVRGQVLARCPRGCGRRARVLWVDPRDPELFPTCRRCASIKYATASIPPGPDRALLRVRRARRRIGAEERLGAPLPPKPPQTWWKTWERLQGAVTAAEAAYEREVGHRIRRHLGAPCATKG